MSQAREAHTHQTTVSIGQEPVETAESLAILADYFADLDAVLDQPVRPRSHAERVDGLGPPTGLFLLARLSGVPVGCVGLRRLDPRQVEVKRLYVAARARRTGLGERLMRTAQAAAGTLTDHRDARLVLDTDPQLLPARTLYERLGFVEVPPYNDNPLAGAWYAKPLHQVGS